MLELVLLLPERNQNYRQIEGPVRKQLNPSGLLPEQLELRVNLCSIKMWGVALSMIAYNDANIRAI